MPLSLEQNHHSSSNHTLTEAGNNTRDIWRENGIISHKSPLRPLLCCVKWISSGDSFHVFKITCHVVWQERVPNTSNHRPRYVVTMTFAGILICMLRTVVLMWALQVWIWLVTFPELPTINSCPLLIYFQRKRRNSYSDRISFPYNIRITIFNIGHLWFHVLIRMGLGLYMNYYYYHYYVYN